MAVQIPCPQCGAVLKLRDRSLLGRTGKCPKCGHRFTLADPDEVELELAPPAAEEPLRVGAARRVADESSSPEPAAPPAASAEPAETVEFPPFVAADDAISGTAKLRALRRKRSRQRRVEIVVGGLVAVAVAGASWAAYSRFGSRPVVAPAEEREPPKRNAAYLSERDRLERTAELIAADSPTDGKPITLRYVPAGTSLVIHVRPAELWKAGSIGEEVRYCLGEDFDAWAAGQIEKYCLLPPAEIDEATICLILGARGSEPLVAAVVRPVEPRKTSELIRLFNGSPQEIDGVQVYVGADRAYLVGNERDDEKRPLTFATAPAMLAGDLATSASSPGLTSDAVGRLLERTDRQRHLTLVFQSTDLRVHEETLVPPDVGPTWNQMLDRLGDDAEAAAWSVHFAGSDFYSELLVRNDPTRTPTGLVEELTAQLDALPKELVDAVAKMAPAEVGDRKLIGRLPAMMQLFAAATIGGIDDRLVVLQTRLPERAGPNLALAGLLAWHESTRTDFTKQPDTSPTDTPTATLAQRLATPIEVEFRRTPLEEAFVFIGGETGVAFEIDGEALKLAGYTRNMPQTIALGTVPAEKAIAAILAQYDKMAVVLDERGDKALVTTKAAAEERGQTPASFAP